jgi:ABC-type multidrug transport system permease subunit
MPFKLPFKIPFKRQYSLRNQNRWLHWLALQNLFSERTHFQIHDIQPDRLGGRFQKLIYRILFGIVAGLLLGGYFGLLYSPVLLPIPSSIHTIPAFPASWQAKLDASILVELPTMLRNSVIAGIFIGWTALIIHAMRGIFDTIQWMSPLQWKIKNLLFFCLPIIIFAILDPKMVGPAIIFSASLMFAFALTPKAQRTIGKLLII